MHVRGLFEIVTFSFSSLLWLRHWSFPLRYALVFLVSQDVFPISVCIQNPLAVENKCSSMSPSQVSHLFVLNHYWNCTLLPSSCWHSPQTPAVVIRTPANLPFSSMCKRISVLPVYRLHSILNFQFLEPFKFRTLIFHCLKSQNINPWIPTSVHCTDL